MRWAQRRCYVRSHRTTCAGCAATATSARPIRTGGWRNSCRRARWTGTAHGDCSVRTASGCRRFCCRAAWSLLRGRDRKSPADGCSLQARSPRQLWPSLRSLRGMSTGTSPSRAHGLPAGTAPRRLSDGERSPRIALFTYQSHSSASSAFSLLVYLAGIDGDFHRP